jgi:integrase
MPITYSKRHSQWLYQFDRVIAGQRQRANKLLPKSWTQTQAQEFDRIETARLYALAAGVTKPVALIDNAVLLYLTEHAPSLKNYKQLRSNLAAMHAYYTGQPMHALADVARSYTTDHAGTMAAGTLRNHLAYLRAACRWAWKAHHLGDHDPAERMRLPKVNNARQVYLSRADMLAIARAMHSERGRTGQRKARAAMRCAFYSGMRLNEIARATIAHTPAGAEFVLLDSKNGTPRRIPVHPKIAHIVRNRTLWPVTLHDTTVSQYVKAAMVASGHGHARFHDLRHSTASAMLNAGVDLYTIGGVLGHKSAASTQRYAHLATATLRSALATIGKNPQTRPVAKAA